MTKTTASKSSAAKDQTAEKIVKAAQEKVSETVEKTMSEATKNFDEVSAFSKANYDAFTASGNAAVKLAQSVNADLVAASKKAVEKNIDDMKALFAVKSPADFFTLQADLMKGRYEELVAETTRLNEVATNATEEVINPLKSRYEEIAEKYKLPLAS